MSGAIFETWVFSEILKSYWHNAQQAYFYRDKDRKEVNLLIERDNTLYPVEIKKTASPSVSATRNFGVLGRLEQTIGPGAVICLKESMARLSNRVTAIPSGYL